MAGSASERFARQYRALVLAESRIGKALDKRSQTWLGTKNVFGYGVGRKHGELAAVFFVRRKVKRHLLAPKDRLPRFIVVGGKRVPTDVVRSARPKFLAEPVGDSSANRKSYRYDGQGDWQMGVEISVWERKHPNEPANLINGGTAGARVLSKDPTDIIPKVLTCAHVLKQNFAEVAQVEETASTAPGFPNNMVGAASNVISDLSIADAGLIECAGALREIMHIGLPRQVQLPFVGLYVMKSGAMTGLTWSRVTETNGKFRLTRGGQTFDLSGLFRMGNTCPQDPAGPGKLPSDVTPGTFSWKGDSGSLIVIGKANAPGVWGQDGLQRTYDVADAAEKATIRDTWERAALGLLCLGSAERTTGQVLVRALSALNVKLDI